jgi:hypothetical protein
VVTFLLLLALALVSTPLAARAQSSSPSASQSNAVSADEGVRGQKLVLKDGTYQLVSKYEVIGDRVRYYSVERSEWEEIPASMVDWAATKKAAEQPNERVKKAVALAHRVDLEENPGSLDVDAGTGLPPGVLLPPGDGMFAFNGKSVLHLKTHLAKSKLNKGRFLASVLVPVPVVSNQYIVSLPGKRAAIRIANPEPLFFYRTNSYTAPRFRLVRAKVKGKRREIEFLNNLLGMKKTEADEIPVEVEKLHADTYRISAKQDLSPGEYVLATVDPGQGIDLYVWDFGIDGPRSKPARKK